jgi:hypothetical protein
MIEHLSKKGFTILPDVFSGEELSAISQAIDSSINNTPDFRQNKDLFAIRRFFQAVPEAGKLVWNRNLIRIVKELCGQGYFVVKSIYFDKPSLSNWFVSWHQDLTISVDQKIDSPGFLHWTEKLGQIAVQPPVNILESIYTIRIHLDDCDESNGALRVVQGSHSKGVIRAETMPVPVQEMLCEVKAGGVMIMRPLLMHSSKRSTSERQRRVIHIEISNLELPDGMKWGEKGIEI